MVLFRAAGWLLLALGAGAFVYDGLTWWSEGVFRLLDLGGLWARLDLGSLRAVQVGLQDVLSGVIWTGLLLPICPPSFSWNGRGEIPSNMRASMTC